MVMSEVRFVSADWLAENLDEVHVVDVRDAWEYDSIGHVPGAVNVPFDAFRAKDGEEGMMPPEDEWVDLLETSGVTADDPLVAYDDTHGVFAARFLVTALYFGHEDLALLDGDYSAWIRSQEATTERPDVDRMSYDAGTASEDPFVDADAVLDAIDDPGAVVVDTREPDEFAAGHLPGAVNLDWKELVDQETRGLKSRDSVETLLADRGISPEKQVVLYCNTARRISHTFVVLRHLGYEDVAFYEGSLTDWAERGHPVE
jgi:thiosulfate/3-mercaptopyruvate sulfurtransferase